MDNKEVELQEQMKESKAEEMISERETPKVEETPKAEEMPNTEDVLNVEEKSETERTPNKKKKIIIIVLISLLVVLMGGVGVYYWRVAVFYRTHFLPNTTVNGIACDKLEAGQVALMVENQILEYSLEVTGRLNEEGEQGVLGVISVKDIDLHYLEVEEAVERLLEAQNEWMWIEVFADKHYSHSLVLGVGYKQEMLEDCLKEWDAFRSGKKPKDAYISDYSEENGYVIIPETLGTQLDVQLATEWIGGAILMQEESVDLEELNCYESASLTAEDEELKQNVAKVNQWLETEITYDWNGSEVIVDKEVIRDWISFEGNEPQLDEEAVAEFVVEQAEEFDTYGKNRYFTTTLGMKLNLPSGAYGWKTDREGEAEELLRLIYQGSKEEREPIFTSKGRWKGVNDIGNSYVEADLTNQHLYLYWKGTLVLETDFVSGEPHVPGNRTPAGVFGLTYKTTNAVLRGENYETPVTYWMPFHGNFGMHDATWRTEFGGDIYITNGSHGCLNLPLDKAAEIYGYLSEGFPIICYYY